MLTAVYATGMLLFWRSHAFPRDSAKFYATILVDGFQVHRIFRREVRKKEFMRYNLCGSCWEKKNDLTASVVARRIMSGFKICFRVAENVLNLIHVHLSISLPCRRVLRVKVTATFCLRRSEVWFLRWLRFLWLSQMQ